MDSVLHIDKDGVKRWKLPNGKLHREDGPAYQSKSGFGMWYLNGIGYSEQEHKKKMRLKKLKHIL